MAAVDSLIKMMTVRNAEALTICSEKVPQLRRGGITEPLSMPPLSTQLVNGFVREVGGISAREYQTEDGTAYALSVEDTGGQIRMTIVPRSDSPPPANSTVPASVPLAAPRAQAASTASKWQAEGTLTTLLRKAEQSGASDLILSSGHNAWLRINGHMREIPDSALDETCLLASLGVESEILGEAGSIDLALQGQRLRFRVNVFRQARGVAAALRPIRTNPPTVSELNLPAELQRLTGLPNGLVLVAGAAGSGKSTTLVALIEHLNRAQSKHIITLEDPIEYLYSNQRCLIHQREIGQQVDSFATGLRAALRESPDVIVVGEMRDRKTIAAALTAAETGHLVLATLHASNAMVAIDRIIDVFPSDHQRQIRYQVSTTLRAIITQHLLASPVAPGRVPAIELMMVNDAVAAHIRDDKNHQIPSDIQTGRAGGMIPLELSLANLVRDGLIAPAIGRETAKEVRLFEELCAGRG